MIAENTSSSRGSSLVLRTTKPLKRGKACMNCRFLKIKCDGAKPICGPCERHPKDDECEYSDGPGRSRTKALEDQVIRLEARLQELENPEASTPSVRLHDPYGQFHDSQRFSKSPPLFVPTDPVAFAPLSPFSPTSTSSSLPSGRHWNTFSALEAMTESTGSSGSSKSPIRQIPTNSPFLGAEEPSYLLIQNLLDKFLPHATEFGFFLHPPTFRTSSLLAFPFGHQSRPSPALLSAVYLWGVHLSQSEALLLQEHAFLTRAVQHLATDMLGVHPNRVLHSLQAQVLLAYYFFRTGRFLEAKWYTGGSVALALGAGYHKIRSQHMVPPPILGISHDQGTYLERAQTNLEEGERINGFWTVFMLHKLMAVALEPPYNVCGTLEAPGIQIDVPWPLRIDRYISGLMGPEATGDATIRLFLSGAPDKPFIEHSAIAMASKASTLFHRAVHLIGQWTPNMLPREFQAFASAFQSIHRLIESFRAQLPPVSQYEPGDPDIRGIILTHGIANAALIKLHTIFSYHDSASKQHCLNAARNIIYCDGVNWQETGYLNPMMATLWMTACLVFIDEISRLRMPRDPPFPPPPPNQLTEEELMEHYCAGLKLMSLFSEDSVLTRYQLTKVQESFSVI